MSFGLSAPAFTLADLTAGGFTLAVFSLAFALGEGLAWGRGLAFFSALTFGSTLTFGFETGFFPTFFVFEGGELFAANFFEDLTGLAATDFALDIPF